MATETTTKPNVAPPKYTELTYDVCQWAKGCRADPLANKPYCSKHKCTASGCGKPKDTRSFGRRRDICVDHQCRNCTKPRLTSIKSSFCEAHKCQEEECPFGEFDAQTPWCVEKHKCENEKCGQARVKGSSYCEKHKCATKKCVTVAKKAGGHCEDHACTDCARPRMVIEGKEVRPKWCTEHKCNAKTCFGRRQDEQKAYCEPHTCKQPDCVKLRVLQAGRENQKARWCKEHCCGNATCNNGIAKGSKFCPSHKCVVVLSPAEESDVAPVSCPEARFQTGKYCEAHKCTRKGCYERCRSKLGGLCKTHVCAWNIDGETCEVAKWTVLSAEGGEHCEKHTCGETGCRNRRGKNGKGDYCQQHTCTIVECEGQTNSKTSYCAQHKCADDRCRLKRLTNNEFCRNHTQ